MTQTGADSCDGLVVGGGQSGAVSNAGTIGGAGASNAVQVDSGGTITELTNSSSGTVRGGAGYGINNLGTIDAVTNAGTISGALIGIVGTSGSPSFGTITNTGAISGNSAIGLLYGGRIETILNGASGTITAVSGSALLFQAASAAGSITNEGQITSTTGGLVLLDSSSVQSFSNTGTIASGNYGIYATSATSLGTITNSGSMSGNSRGVVVWGGLDSLTNSGTITATSASGLGLFGSASTSTVSNSASGTISGAFAVVIGATREVTLFENAGTLSSSGTGTSGLTVQTGALVGTISNSGTIQGEYGFAATNSSTVRLLTNTGTIAGTAPAAVGLIVQNTALVDTIRNYGTVSGGYGVAVSGSGRIGSLENSGVITGSGYRGVWISSTTASIGTITNTGTISGPESGVRNAGTLTTLENSGTISGTSYGILNEGTISAITNNAGAVLSGGITGIFVASGAGIGTLTNGQGGNGSSGATTALTYDGALPGSYYVQISGTAAYGQMVVTNASGAMSVGIVPASGAAIRGGRYEDVLSGVEPANLTNTSGKYGNADWRIENDGTHYDLIIGPDSASTLAGLSAHADLTRRVLVSRGLSAVFALDNDCRSWSALGYCIAVQTGAGGLGGGLEARGSMTLAKRLTPSLRVGGFVDLRGPGRDTATVTHGDPRPALGAFVGYAEREDGSGLETKAAFVIHREAIALARESGRDGTEAGQGRSRLGTFAASLSLGYGLPVGDMLLVPHAGLRHVVTRRSSYSEEETADTVFFPLSYRAYSQTATTASAGLRVSLRVNDRTMLQLDGGMEIDVFRKSSALRGSSSISGLTSFDVQARSSDARARPYGSAGLEFAASEAGKLNLRVSLQSLPFASQPAVTAMAGYRFAL